MAATDQPLPPGLEREYSPPSTARQIASAAIDWLPFRGEQTSPPTGWVQAFSVLEPSTPLEHVGTGHGRGAVTVGHGGIWVANRQGRSVARVEPEDLHVTAIQRFRKIPVDVEAGPSAVWALGANDRGRSRSTATSPGSPAVPGPAGRGRSSGSTWPAGP